ncbi:MAG TPA: hypothetical protein VE972_09525 [Conexibacter sp.]|jgi:hypothetical protein|nr:hypothetical protein [Conexibacter sp.]
MDTLSLEPDVHVNVMLADFAQVADGKLNVIGGGWSVTGPEPCPFALAGLFEVPWQMTNRQHEFRFELIDADGNAVTVETPEGEHDVSFEGAFEVGRPPGLRVGGAQRVPFALNAGALPLQPGMHYEWRLTLNGRSHDEWRLPFTMRATEA